MYDVNLNLRIEQDQDVFNPREDFDHACTMVCWHKRYMLGDKHTFLNNEDFIEWARDAQPLMLPLYLYDHSGLTMNITGFACPWDSGQVGWIYITLEDVKKEFGDLSNASLQKAWDLMNAEVKEYDQYLRGDVWGYIIEDDDGNHIDSCWGFFGHDFCEAEARSILKEHEDLLATEQEETAKG